MTAKLDSLFTDIEVYKDYFYVGMKRLSDGLRRGFELSRRKNEIDPKRLRSILLQNTIIGFNLDGYDAPLLWYLIDLLERGLPVAEINRRLKTQSDIIIKTNMRKWHVPDHLGIRIPRQFDSIDLIEPQPNAIASLKTLNGRLFGKRMQDLPFDPDADLTDDEIEQTNDYCLTSDLDATHNLLNALKEPMELRIALGEQYGHDFRSMSDSQIGEWIVKHEVQKITGQQPKKVETRPGTTFRYNVPDFMRFETPELQAILERIRLAEFYIGHDGKTVPPDWLDGLQVELGGMTYTMGIGGLHSTEKHRAIYSDDEYALVDADVASQYPSIIDLLGLYPESLGPVFLEVYRALKNRRIVAKKRGKQIKDVELPTLNDVYGKTANQSDRNTILAQIAALESELKQCKAADKGLKIALNGVYGKLGSWYSILYAPHLLVAVTLTGQLTLLMLIERALKRGIGVKTGNTDGVTFYCPRDLYAGMQKDADGNDTDRLAPSVLADVCAEWERDTTFSLEFVEYKAMFSRSISDYFALKANGGHKRKGVYGNWWSEHPDDADPRNRLMKNPTATVISDAVLNLLKDGTPLEDTIYGCTDIKQFVSIIKSSTGATWRGRYLGKTVRYYWSTDGDEILKAKPNTKGTYALVPKTDGAAPCMTLPDDLPDDIDYGRYIAEAKKVLIEIGYTPAPPKMVRFTKGNSAGILFAWALAA